MRKPFDVQGHRGARGLKPENTLPAFEAALDLQVTTLEADLHFTKDGAPLVFHDEAIDPRLVRIINGANVPAPAEKPLISNLTAAQLSGYRADLNPDKVRFPHQDNQSTTVATEFVRRRQVDSFTPPTLADLFAFVDAYAGELGKQMGKSDGQRRRAREVRFSLELKRVPFRPKCIGDSYDGTGPGEFEKAVVNVVHRAGAEARTIIQSFDHRCVREVRTLAPEIQGAALIYNTVPVSIEKLTRDATAQIYSPDYQFLDVQQVRQAQAASIRVIPWTVNEKDEMKQLIDWGVDGIISDYPDRLIALLQSRGIPF